MTKRLRKISALLLLSLLFLMLAGCPGDDPWYKGHFVDLNSVANNSLLGIFGVDNNNIVIIDEDSFGRKMFIYWGNTVAAYDQLNYDKPPAVYSILISQKTEGGRVCFYPDYNFVVYKDTRNILSRPHDEDLLNYAKVIASADDIEWLKQENDWEKPIDESKCVSVKISRINRMQESKTLLVSEKILKNAYEQVDTPQNYFSLGLFYYLTSDQYDRHIYYFRCRKEDRTYTKSYVVMFNKDGTFDPDTGIMEIIDVWNYQDDLKAFKELNGWNTPVV